MSFYKLTLRAVLPRPIVLFISKSKEYLVKQIHSFQFYNNKLIGCQEFSGKTGCIAFLEDCSSNGTFINGEKIGKGRVQALKNCQEISLAKRENKAFIFIDLSNKDDENYSPLVTQKYTITKLLGSFVFFFVKFKFK